MIKDPAAHDETVGWSEVKNFGPLVCARGTLEVMLSDGFFDPRKPVQIRWGDLPHWRQEGALYFVTFRLGDSLPQTRLEEWRLERDQWRAAHPEPSGADLEEFSMRRRRRIERWLDQGYGSCVLLVPEVRALVEKTIRHFEGVRYELGEFTVASNHVHALVRTALGTDLSQVLQSWKRHSSREMRKIEKVRRMFPKEGHHLWQVESFDHIVRNGNSLEKISEYIRSHER